MQETSSHRVCTRTHTRLVVVVGGGGGGGSEPSIFQFLFSHFFVVCVGCVAPLFHFSGGGDDWRATDNGWDYCHDYLDRRVPVWDGDVAGLCYIQI